MPGSENGEQPVCTGKWERKSAVYSTDMAGRKFPRKRKES